jgi:hypothetical protein
MAVAVLTIASYFGSYATLMVVYFSTTVYIFTYIENDKAIVRPKANKHNLLPILGKAQIFV